MRMEFVFIEDRDWETGHGWRDAETKYFTHSKDGPVMVQAFWPEPDTDDGRYGPEQFAEFSYAWICPKEYYDRHNHMQDNIRTDHIRAHHPTFAGSDDMESHFAFKMTPDEMKKHLIKLGFIEVVRKI